MSGAQEEAPSHIAPWARSELVFREEYPEFQVAGSERGAVRSAMTRACAVCTKTRVYNYT
jgi:hypothetical protein